MKSRDATTPKIRITGNVQELLAKAPDAVDSYHPGHWELMRDLERRAIDVLHTVDIEKAISFFVDVAFLKQPYEIDRELVRSRLHERHKEIQSALPAYAGRLGSGFSRYGTERIARFPSQGQGRSRCGVFAQQKK